MSLSVAPAMAADSWTGNDKVLHFAGSAGIALLVTNISRDPSVGFWSSVAVGAAKELVDQRKGGDASLRDLVVDVAGAYLGSETGRWMLYRNRQTTTLVASWRF
jgi:uncharacterized protein YfiM (DUF2279 family)